MLEKNEDNSFLNNNDIYLYNIVYRIYENYFKLSCGLQLTRFTRNT